jgi:hypothetical protein
MSVGGPANVRAGHGKGWCLMFVCCFLPPAWGCKGTLLLRRRAPCPPSSLAIRSLGFAGPGRSPRARYDGGQGTEVPCTPCGLSQLRQLGPHCRSRGSKLVSRPCFCSVSCSVSTSQAEATASKEEAVESAITSIAIPIQDGGRVLPWCPSGLYFLRPTI